MNEVIERLNKLEKYFAEEIEDKKFIEEIGLNTKIIKQKNDIQFIVNRLINNDENKKQKKINFNLLYRATRDGDTSNNFHNRVDNKNSHLSIIETKKGLKFGVYIDKPFKGTGNVINDNNCFIFSLNLKKIYNNKEGANSFNDCSNYLIDLNYQPIRIYDYCLSNEKSYTETKMNASINYYGFEKDYELNNYEKHFQVKEIETFQITFN